MKLSTTFLTLAGVAAIAAFAAGCGTSGPAPLTLEQPPPATSTPAPGLLYVDHNGTFFEYRLPLTQSSKPVRTLSEWPGLPVPPQFTADQYGNVAVASPTQLRIFRAPIRSFDPSHAQTKIKLTPAMTGIGPDGALLADIEFDPNENLWLFNNLGGLGGITELRPPIKAQTVASVIVIVGAKGSKTSGFTVLTQGRFDINATLYFYASASYRSRLFKLAFPYAKQPGTTGLDLKQADFVDSSDWPPTAPNTPALLLGQYNGALRSPKPGTPPSPPVNVTAQFPQPFNPQVGLFPDAHTDTVVGALAADTYRYSYYTLDADDGTLNVFPLPMKQNAQPTVSLKCLAGSYDCDKREHLFLAP